MQFRKKPVVIEAIQWNGNSNKHEIEMFVEKELKIELESETAYVAGKGAPIFSLLIETLEGTMKANAGDWIIKGVNGEFYPCKNDIFLKTYETPTTQSGWPEEPTPEEIEQGKIENCGVIDDEDAAIPAFYFGVGIEWMINWLKSHTAGRKEGRWTDADMLESFEGGKSYMSCIVQIKTKKDLEKFDLVDSIEWLSEYKSHTAPKAEDEKYWIDYGNDGAWLTAEEMKKDYQQLLEESEQEELDRKESEQSPSIKRPTDEQFSRDDMEGFADFIVKGKWTKPFPGIWESGEINYYQYTIEELIEKYFSSLR